MRAPPGEEARRRQAGVDGGDEDAAAHEGGHEARPGARSAEAISTWGRYEKARDTRSMRDLQVQGADRQQDEDGEGRPGEHCGEDRGGGLLIPPRANMSREPAARGEAVEAQPGQQGAQEQAQGCGHARARPRG